MQMADISIQFHATIDELKDFCIVAAEEFQLHISALRFFPFEAHEVEPDALANYFSYASPYKRLELTTGTPVLPVANELDFRDKNPSSLRLQLGERHSDRLDESWLSARTTEPCALNIWKTLAKRLKGMTEPGAIAVNADAGTSGPARGHRFSQGAIRLNAEGVPLTSITGIVLKPVCAVRGS